MVTLIEPSAPLRQRMLRTPESSTWMSRAKSGRHGLHAFNWPDQPIDEINVMAGLVHERSAVEFPSAAPLCRIVVVLWTSPEDIERDHIDLAKALFFDRPLKQLQSCIAAVLLDNKEVDFRLIAGL
jgi:hypothetical protein